MKNRLNNYAVSTLSSSKLDYFTIEYFSHGHHRKAGREIHIDRMMDDGGRYKGPLVKNQPEPVTGP